MSRIWDKFIPYIRSGALAGECLEELEAGLAEIESSNAKTFLERFGSYRQNLIYIMYYFDPHEIISSLVTPLMDASKRAREYIVEISLNDAPVRVVRRLSVPSNLYVGHFVYVLVYAMGWDGYHLTELTQGNTLWRSTKEKAMDAESGLGYERLVASHRAVG